VPARHAGCAECRSGCHPGPRVISRHQWSSVVISRHQSSSVVMSRHESSSVVISLTCRCSSSMRSCFALASCSACSASAAALASASCRSYLPSIGNQEPHQRGLHARVPCNQGLPSRVALKCCHLGFHRLCLESSYRDSMADACRLASATNWDASACAPSRAVLSATSSARCCSSSACSLALCWALSRSRAQNEKASAVAGARSRLPT